MRQDTLPYCRIVRAGGEMAGTGLDGRAQPVTVEDAEQLLLSVTVTL